MYIPNSVTDSTYQVIIKTVIEFCDEEFGNKCLEMTIEKTATRSTKYAGVNKA
jgi:hypothetical protein